MQVVDDLRRRASRQATGDSLDLAGGAIGFLKQLRFFSFEEEFVQDVAGKHDKAKKAIPDAMAPLPDESERILTILLEKRVTSGHLTWQSRDIVLTENALLFARPDEDMTIDCIGYRLLYVRSIPGSSAHTFPYPPDLISL
jgi:hypothetical protein